MLNIGAITSINADANSAPSLNILLSVLCHDRGTARNTYATWSVVVLYDNFGAKLIHRIYMVSIDDTNTDTKWAVCVGVLFMRWIIINFINHYDFYFPQYLDNTWKHTFQLFMDFETMFFWTLGQLLLFKCDLGYKQYMWQSK